MRNVPEVKNWKVAKFEVFCPKIIANISGLPDTLSSRAIKLIILRAEMGNIKANLDVNESDSIWQDIRNELYTFALDNWMNIENNYKFMKCEGGFSNRDWELWKPIFSIAKSISEEVYTSLVDYAKQKLDEKNMEESSGESWENYLLDVLEANVKENRWYSLKKEILEWLLMKYFVEKSYWNNKTCEMTTEFKNIKPSERWIANILRKLPNINTRLVRGVTEVQLNPIMINELINRLQVKTNPKLLKDLENKIVKEDRE